MSVIQRDPERYFALYTHGYAAFTVRAIGRHTVCAEKRIILCRDFALQCLDCGSVRRLTGRKATRIAGSDDCECFVESECPQARAHYTIDRTAKVDAEDVIGVDLQNGLREPFPDLAVAIHCLRFGAGLRYGNAIEDYSVLDHFTDPRDSGDVECRVSVDEYKVGALAFGDDAERRVVLAAEKTSGR